ncbi:MAG: FtsX-like permease family protein, partial [Acidobacteriaceae bacterium]
HTLTGGGATYQIIGVVKNIKSRTYGEPTRYVLFRSLAQNTGSDPSFLGYQLLVHYSGDPGAVIQATRAQIRALDPNMAVYGVETMQEHLSKALFLPRLAGTLFGVFGFIGLTLAAVGLYGVISYSVAHRTHEIGIRLALGAPLSAIRGLVLRQGMSLIVIAIAIGMPAAWFAAKFSRSFLYGVRPHDPITFLVVPLFLAAIALIACWVPARRATRTDPQTALRYE